MTLRILRMTYFLIHLVMTLRILSITYFLIHLGMA